MKVHLRYLGFCGTMDHPYMYSVMTETGIADVLYEDTFVAATEVEMPDEIWAENSGWADVECDACGTNYSERTAPGLVVSCPCCGEPIAIPTNYKLRPNNTGEDVDVN